MGFTLNDHFFLLFLQFISYKKKNLSKLKQLMYKKYGQKIHFSFDRIYYSSFIYYIANYATEQVKTGFNQPIFTIKFNMGDCSSIQEQTLQTNQTQICIPFLNNFFNNRNQQYMLSIIKQLFQPINKSQSDSQQAMRNQQAFQAPQEEIRFQEKQDHNCSSVNVYYQNVPQQSPQLTQFNKMILTQIISHHLQPKQGYKEQLFKNVELLDFRLTKCFGGIEILNDQISFPVLQKNKVKVMAISNFGKGRAFAISNQEFLSRFIAKDKDYIIFLRNIVRYLSKNKVNSKQKPLKVLFTSSQPDYNIISSLERAQVYIDVDFQPKISAVDLSKYDCIFISQFSSKIETIQDCSNVTQFVKNGGGLYIVLRGWVFQHYGEGKNSKDWINQCYYNRILAPMGMRFNQQSVNFDELKLNQKQIINLHEQVQRPYKKQQKPKFSIPNTQQIQKQRSVLQADRDAILKNVGDLTFGKGLAASSYSFDERSAIPILTENNKDFCVSGRFGKGKIFLFGHTDIYEKKFVQNKANETTLLQNVVKWMCGNKQNISLGLLHKSASWSKPQSFTNIGMNISYKYVDSIQQFKDIDIACLTYCSNYPATMTPQFNLSVKKYVQKGGNLFFVSHGWVWQYYGQYKKNNSLVYEVNFANYVFIKLFGINLNNDCFSVSVPLNPVIAKKKDDIVQNFLKNDLLDVLKNEKKNSFSTQNEKLNSIISKLGSIDPKQFQKYFNQDLYHTLVDAFVLSRFNIQKNYNKLSFNDPFICNVFKIMDAISYLVPPQVCRALPPSLNGFPGYATKVQSQIDVQVYKNKNKIIFTGLYLNPGEVVKVTHSNDVQNTAGVNIRINFNSDLSNRNNGNLKRFTNISKRFKIKPRQFLIASPHGGIIFFQIPNKSNDGKPLNFKFQGAYRAPYWNQNIHSFDDFEKIKKIQAPYFVIETKRINLIGPTKKVLGSLNINIEKLCNFWNKVVGIYKDYRGIEQYPFEKDSICNDVNIMLGYMHSGNPVMTHDDLTFQMIGLGDKLFTNATWGFYHQLGHNHQDYKWTFNQTVEVTCNIYSLLLINKMHGTTIKENMWIERKLQQPVRKYFNSSKRDLQQYGKDPFLALCLYAVIMEQFGYEVFSQVHKRYNSINLSNPTVQMKLDRLVQELSEVIQQNLWYYFKNWGMPVSNDSLSKISHLKKYQCKKFPFITDK